MNLNRVIETFIPIEVPADSSQGADWYTYLNTMRLLAIPLLRSKRKEIGWYSFLLHFHEEDNELPKLCVHIRMELRPKVNIAQFINRLPIGCKGSKLIPRGQLSCMPGIDISALRNQDLKVAWKALGEASKAVVAIIDTNADGESMSVRNVFQFLHFIGNQLCTSRLGIKMP